MAGNKVTAIVRKRNSRRGLVCNVEKKIGPAAIHFAVLRSQLSKKSPQVDEKSEKTPYDAG